MGLLNLTKDGKYIFNRVVNSVKFYDKDQAAQLLGEIGHMSKSAVSITCIPRSTELIGGNKYQLGYDITIEITSEQLYGMFEFDKLKNKNVWIAFPELPLFFSADTTLNVEVMMNLGETTGKVKISAGAYATDLIVKRNKTIHLVHQRFLQLPEICMRIVYFSDNGYLPWQGKDNFSRIISFLEHCMF